MDNNSLITFNSKKLNHYNVHANGIRKSMIRQNWSACVTQFLVSSYKTAMQMNPQNPSSKIHNRTNFEEFLRITSQ